MALAIEDASPALTSKSNPSFPECSSHSLGSGSIRPPFNVAILRESSIFVMDCDSSEPGTCLHQFKPRSLAISSSSGRSHVDRVCFTTASLSVRLNRGPACSSEPCVWCPSPVLWYIHMRLPNSAMSSEAKCCSFSHCMSPSVSSFTLTLQLPTWRSLRWM